MEMLMLRRTEMSLFGLYFHMSMLYSSTKVMAPQFGRYLENIRTTTPLFNDIYFRFLVISQLGGCAVYGISALPMIYILIMWIVIIDNSQLSQRLGACQLKDCPEGFMGKLRVRKSGKVELVLGENIMEVLPGLPVNFHQVGGVRLSLRRLWQPDLMTRVSTK